MTHLLDEVSYQAAQEKLARMRQWLADLRSRPNLSQVHHAAVEMSRHDMMGQLIYEMKHYRAWSARHEGRLSEPSVNGFWSEADGLIPPPGSDEAEWSRERLEADIDETRSRQKRLIMRFQELRQRKDIPEDDRLAAMWKCGELIRACGRAIQGHEVEPVMVSSSS